MDDHVTREAITTTNRRAPAEPAPSDRVSHVLGLLDDLAAVVGVSDRLMRGIQQLTGLRPGEIRVVLALSPNAQPLDEIARRLGEIGPATANTIDGLVKRGVLRRTNDGESIGLSETGAATVEQLQGVQIRLLDALADAAGESGVQVVRATLQALIEVAGIVGDHTEHLPLSPSAAEAVDLTARTPHRWR